MFEKFYSMWKYFTNRYKIEKKVKIIKVKILHYKRYKMLLVNYMGNNSSVIKSLAQKGYYIAKIKYKRYN